MQRWILNFQSEEVGINEDQALASDGVKFVLVSLNMSLDCSPLRAESSSDGLVQSVEFAGGLAKNGGFPGECFGEGCNNLIG